MQQDSKSRQPSLGMLARGAESFLSGGGKGIAIWGSPHVRESCVRRDLRC